MHRGMVGSHWHAHRLRLQVEAILAIVLQSSKLDGQGTITWLSDLIDLIKL